MNQEVEYYLKRKGNHYFRWFSDKNKHTLKIKADRLSEMMRSAKYKQTFILTIQD